MRDWLWRGLVLLLLALVGVWLAFTLEWGDEEIYIPPKDEAATNPLYGAQALARELGAHVTKQTSLDTLPPPGATLVLTSVEWNLLPGREQALHEWVKQGGHLVIPSYALNARGEDNPLGRWLPVRLDEGKRKPRPKTDTGAETKPNDGAQAKPKPKPHDDSDAEDDDDDDGADDEADSGGADASEKPDDGDAPVCRPPELIDRDPCHHLLEPGGARFRICDTYPTELELKPDAALQWSAAERGHPPALLRAAVEQGSVTVVGVWSAFSRERWRQVEPVLEGDHAHAWAATLRLRPGMELWFVAEESRPSLPLWLWLRGWPAVLLGLLALAAALWRAAPRFGPRQALPRVERRSMAEQIIGTAHFLARSDGQALHRAQLRALDEAAAPRLRRWAQMDANARARALSTLTGLPADALARAMSGEARNPARLDADLATLETAVRGLRSSSTTA